MFVLAGFDVIKPDPGLILWTTVFFVIFWAVMAKFALKPIANALKKREADIQNSLDEAALAREEMSNLKAENESLLAEAREEKANILKEAREVKEKMITEAKTKAKEEAKKIVADAQNEIENQKMAAITEVKNQVGTMAIEIAEKVLRKQLSGNTEQEAYVKTLVDEIELN